MFKKFTLWVEDRGIKYKVICQQMDMRQDRFSQIINGIYPVPGGFSEKLHQALLDLGYNVRKSEIF